MGALIPRGESEGGTDSIVGSCRIQTAVIGQAKRYKAGNTISETQLREFVGAATLERHKLLKDGIIGPLSPVVFAFWTTIGFRSECEAVLHAS